MLTRESKQSLHLIFKALGEPFRIQLILALSSGEACVCHLEQQLGKRQAYISQQLRLLRKAGLLSGRREGKFVFYSLKHPETVELIRQAARMAGLSLIEIAQTHATTDGPGCSCPHCSPNLIQIESIGETHANH